ncbi:hypothetical protein OJF2_63220 [Aquisphaera giovannonii]|uniref:Peptidoglycan O-acetyltransferase n=1 Tax=Aquisphaera giovannonii TaxID=406548 RepID=A0A5B9WCR3_9BACT|nr:hypothetical protein [Aquisphaera giovannonii]QEH37731.1 hypothetical protein OJF2_63220 [Aquisphaera giovannonii]
MGTEVRRAASARRPLHERFVAPGSRAEDAASAGRRGLYAGEPEACRRRLLPFLRSMALLGLLLWLFHAYQIEGRAFLALVTIACAALPVHYLAPFRWKKPLFAATSVAGLFWVIGAGPAAAVLGLAAVLIGTCYLPIRWSARAAILAALGAGMGVAKAQGLLAIVPATAWPIAGTMLMFRLILYMYELKHAKRPEGLVDTVGYFFLLPNYCFLHFPVVDYRTFQRGFFAADVHAIQLRGLAMMFRGLLHLICYRLVDHELFITPAEVAGPWSLMGYLACNYLLYLRVSGQFHMACGMLHLFGYQLPDTHHHYLLASGFTDYWRRVNIYWKDFMVRVVFNPVVFRLKRWPQPAALAVATVVVFVTTWALHAYQSFWVRGTWGFSVPDALFWGILGVLVVINVQLDARRAPARGRASAARARAGDAGGIPFGPLAARGLKTAGTLTTLALLWSLWYSPSLSAWMAMMRRGILGA